MATSSKNPIHPIKESNESIETSYATERDDSPEVPTEASSSEDSVVIPVFGPTNRRKKNELFEEFKIKYGPSIKSVACQMTIHSEPSSPSSSSSSSSSSLSSSGTISIS